MSENATSEGGGLEAQPGFPNEAEVLALLARWAAMPAHERSNAARLISIGLANRIGHEADAVRHAREQGFDEDAARVERIMDAEILIWRMVVLMGGGTPRTMAEVDAMRKREDTTWRVTTWVREVAEAMSDAVPPSEVR